MNLLLLFPEDFITETRVRVIGRRRDEIARIGGDFMSGRFFVAPRCSVVRLRRPQVTLGHVMSIRLKRFRAVALADSGVCRRESENPVVALPVRTMRARTKRMKM